VNNCMFYVLDDDDRILEVGGDWDAFARANDGLSLCDGSVIGSRLWDHVHGPELQDLLGKVLWRARWSDQPIHVNLRCDSPDCVRHLELTLDGTEPNRLVVRSRVAREVARSSWKSGLYPQPLMQTCSWCNRYHVRGTWMEIEEALQMLDVADNDSIPPTTHGICPECAGQLRRLAQSEPIHDH